MKKFITLTAAVVMCLMLSFSVLAAPAGFVESPTAEAPTLVTFENEDPSCEAGLTVTSYIKRGELSAEGKAELEAAYNSIIANGNALAGLSEMKNIPLNRLAVSELFDVSYHETGMHNEHGAFTITVKATKSLKGFAGLLHFHNGAWEIVENAKANGDELTFTVSDLSPFAIVVETEADMTQPSGSGDDSPQTGDNTSLWLWGSIAVVSLIAVVVLAVKSKKTRD